MKLIQKQPEPNYLKNHRLKVNTIDDGIRIKTDYNSFCKEIGLGDIQPPTGFRKHLLDEQGYLCAYCMRQIPHKHEEKGVASDDMKVEHRISQTDKESIANKLDITHANMFACCMGGEGMKEKFQTCDTRKKDAEITINPIDKLHVDTIKYGLDGSITSTNAIFDNEINKVLNLNENNLKKRREAIYQVVEKRTRDAFKTLMDRKAKNDYLNREIESWLKAKNSKYREYCMVAIVYLQGRIR